MKKIFLLFALIIAFQNGYCQPNNKGRIVDIVIHKVELGETIVMICKKYLVNPNTIYSANKFIIDGINEGMVLQIPVPRKNGQEYATTQYADPVLDEDVTPAAIAAAHNPIADNPIIKDSLAIAENPVAVKEPETVVEEPVIKEPEVVTKTEPVAVTEPIVAKEPEPIAENPVIKEPETVVVQPVAVKKTPEVAVNEPEKDPVFENKRLTITKIDRDQETEYTIQKKETLFAISKRYDVSMEEIMERNQEVLKNGLVAGQVIIIPATKKIVGWGDDTAKSDSNQGVTTDKTTETPVAKEPVAVNTPAIKTENKVVTNTPSPTKTVIQDKVEGGFTTHKVVAGETLYSLSKKYKTSVEAINDNNEKVKKSGLGIGMILKIPVAKEGDKTAETGVVAELDKKLENFVAPVRTLNETDILHKVEAKETLLSISKKYNVSIYDIRSNNESVMSKGLQAGQTIRIPQTKKAIDIASKVDEIATKQAEDAPTDKASNSEVYIIGDIITTVQANETLEDIAKKYDVTPEEIIQNNALLLKDGKVKAGQVIKVPANKGAVEYSPETFD
jgi:LysM repeat protein